MMSDASDMLAAALEQMDGIIAGSKALEYSNGLFDCQSPTSPFMGSLRALHLVEDLRGLLEVMETDEKEGLRCQVPDSTAETLVAWLQSHLTNGHLPGNGDVYQERLARLENDKESLVLQVSVLTDQVEAQGEKIRDLEFCLEEHREKLNATEEMLQQELLSRTSLETQKLDLMAEISNLKLKLTAVEKDRLDYEDRFRDTEGLVQEISDLRLKVTEMDNEKLQYEKKLKSTKEELASLKEQLEEKECEVRRLQEKLVCRMRGEGVEILDRGKNAGIFCLAVGEPSDLRRKVMWGCIFSVKDKEGSQKPGQPGPQEFSKPCPVSGQRQLALRLLHVHSPPPSHLPASRERTCPAATPGDVTRTERHRACAPRLCSSETELEPGADRNGSCSSERSEEWLQSKLQHEWNPQHLGKQKLTDSVFGKMDEFLQNVFAN